MAANPSSADDAGLAAADGSKKQDIVVLKLPLFGTVIHPGIGKVVNGLVKEFSRYKFVAYLLTLRVIDHMTTTMVPESWVKFDQTFFSKIMQVLSGGLDPKINNIPTAISEVFPTFFDDVMGGVLLNRKTSMYRACESLVQSMVTNYKVFYKTRHAVLHHYINVQYYAKLTKKGIKALNAVLMFTQEAYHTNCLNIYKMDLLRQRHEATAKYAKNETKANLKIITDLTTKINVYQREKPGSDAVMKALKRKYPALPLRTLAYEAWLLPKDKDTHAQLKRVVQMNQVISASNAKRLKKNPSLKLPPLRPLGPIPKYGATFVPITKVTDAAILGDIRNGVRGDPKLCEFVTNNQSTSIFLLPFVNRLIKGREQDGLVQTDGVAVCYNMRTASAVAAKKETSTKRGEAKQSTSIQARVAQHVGVESAEYNRLCQEQATAKGAVKTQIIAKKKAIEFKMQQVEKQKKELAKLERDEEKKQGKIEAAAKKRREMSPAQNKAEADQLVKKKAKKQSTSNPAVTEWATKKNVTTPATLDRYRVVGLDPGQGFLYHAYVLPKTNADPDEVKKQKCLRMSQGEFKEKCGRNAQRRELEQSVKRTLARCRSKQFPKDTMPSLAVTGPALVAAMAVRVKYYPMWYGVYGSMKQRKLAWKTERKTKKVLTAIGKELIPTKATVLAMGDWMNHGPARRGERQGSWNTVEKFLTTRFPSRCFKMDEYRTSKLCCECDGLLSNVGDEELWKKPNGQGPPAFIKNKKGNRVRRLIWGLKDCKHCRIRLNRDRNAAINMAHKFRSEALTNQPHPAYLRGGSKKEREARIPPPPPPAKKARPSPPPPCEKKSSARDARGPRKEESASAAPANPPRRRRLHNTHSRAVRGIPPGGD